MLSNSLTTTQLAAEEIQRISPSPFPAPLSVKSVQNGTLNDPFPLYQLPSELSLQIQSSALAAASTVHVDASSANSPLHSYSSILHALCGPESDKNPYPSSLLKLYHSYTTFSFSSTVVLREFGRVYDRRHHVHHIEVRLSSITNPAQDWPFAILEALPGLNSVSFVWDEPLCDEYELEGLVGWWACYRDAFREGLAPGKKFVMLLVDSVGGIELGAWRSWGRREGDKEANGGNRERGLDEGIRALWKCISFQGEEIHVKVLTSKLHRNLGSGWLLY